MKVIATINFKGGVGKTTITWLLAKYASEQDDKRVLVVDADAQMSLTTALAIDEDRGTFVEGFGNWYENHKKYKKTLLDAIDAYDQYATQGAHFDFPISSHLVYRVTPNLWFIPSTDDLYWLELQVFKPENVKGFIKALLGKIQHSNLPKYDVVFFDCPPSFTLLSYSILSNCSMVLIPVNPDAFAATGLRIMIEGLKGRIQPWPEPKLAVFMNKARLYRKDVLTRETKFFLDQVQQVAKDFAQEGIRVDLLDQFIPERAGIRKAISFGGFPEDFRPYVRELWTSIKHVLNMNIS